MICWSVIFHEPGESKLQRNARQKLMVRVWAFKSYNYESEKWFERDGEKLEEIPKSKWIEPDTLFWDSPVPQMNNWIVTSIQNNTIYFFAVDQATREFTAWCKAPNGQFLFSEGPMSFSRAKSYCRQRNSS